MINRQFINIYWFIESVRLAWYCSSGDAAVFFLRKFFKDFSLAKRFPSEWTLCSAALYRKFLFADAMWRCQFLFMMLDKEDWQLKNGTFLKLHLISFECKVKDVSRCFQLLCGYKIAILYPAQFLQSHGTFALPFLMIENDENIL